MPKYSLKGTIADEKLHIEQLKDLFSDRDRITTKDLNTFYKDVEPDVSDSAIHWRIRTLNEKGILKRVGHGAYRFGKENMFIPELRNAHKKLYRELDEQYPYADKCIWSTSVLNEFMLHQPSRFMTIIETDRDAQNNLFYFLKERRSEVFLETDADIIDRYGAPNKEIVVIKALVTEAPTQEVENIVTATIEKILVDIFCDEKILSTYQGGERSTIYKEAFSKYTVNQNKLLRYAGRRGKRDDLTEYLESLKLLAVKPN